MAPFATGVICDTCTQLIGLVVHRGPDCAALPCRAVGKMFKGKNIEKGVAFPTCVSVNKCDY